MTKIVIVLLFITAYVSMLEVTFEKTELTYFNKKYFNYYDYTLRRANRRSPYIFNLYQDFKYPLGNNLSYKWTVYEIISGREILTPVTFVLHACDAFRNDQYIGKLFADQMPKNWTCPFPVGPNNWTNIVLRFTNWPFIPFTYSSLYVRTLTTIDGYVNNELAHQGRVYAAIKQKLQEEPKTKKKT